MLAMRLQGTMRRTYLGLKRGEVLVLLSSVGLDLLCGFSTGVFQFLHSV